VYIKVSFNDEKGLEVASGIVITMPKSVTTFGARKKLLQEIIHALDHYVLSEITQHLEHTDVINDDSGW